MPDWCSGSPPTACLSIRLRQPAPRERRNVEQSCPCPARPRYKKRAQASPPRPSSYLTEVKPLRALREVHRRVLAAPVDLQLELEPVALVERAHAGALDRGDVDERVGLAVIVVPFRSDILPPRI